jgi:hypothetical protein
MHTLQYIAIQSEDKESAANTVKNLLEEELNPGSSWYDWFVVGGGRFAPNPDDQYDDTHETTISYADTPDIFNEKVRECKQKQGAEFQELLTEYKASGTNLTEMFEAWNGEMEYSMALYPIKKMIDIMQGHWDYTSRVYDITHWSTNTHHLNRSIADGNKNWFLVPIDFHF